MAFQVNLNRLCDEILLKSNTNMTQYIGNSPEILRRDSFKRPGKRAHDDSEALNDSVDHKSNVSLNQTPEPETHLAPEDVLLRTSSSALECSVNNPSESEPVLDESNAMLYSSDRDEDSDSSDCQSNSDWEQTQDGRVSVSQQDHESIDSGIHSVVSSSQSEQCQSITKTRSPSSCSDKTVTEEDLDSNKKIVHPLAERKCHSTSQVGSYLCNPNEIELRVSEPDQKSRKSTSAIRSPSKTSWFSSMNRRRARKTSQSAIPNKTSKDASFGSKLHKSAQNLFSVALTTATSNSPSFKGSDPSDSPPFLPRSNSTGDHEQTLKHRRRFRQPSNSNQNTPKVNRVTRLATTDLRNVANLSMNRRVCQSTEDLDCDKSFDDELDDSTLDIHATPRRLPVEGRRPSPHPQAYYTVDSRKMHKSLRDKKMLTGIKQFNLDPKRGVEYLIEHEIIIGHAEEDKCAKSVAFFLFREGRLSKKQIGQFIGGHDDFNQRVLKEFVQCHQFSGLILVQALRQFLWSFRLPGEAMQIDRIMEAFAEHYCKQNPKLFRVTDTCYMISFAIIMLNTSLHNPNVKRKITVEEFVKQNRGIDSGKDVPREILEQIYKSIKEEPFKIPDETYDDLMYTFFSPEKEGWLLKQGGSWKNWKRRWFVLSDKCLYYFQHTTENVPKGIIPLENVNVRPIEDLDGKSFCFEVFAENSGVVKACKTDSKGTVVQGNHKSYKMSAGSSEERSEWIRNINESISFHPFHDTIRTKKNALRRQQQSQSSNNNDPNRTPSKSSTLSSILRTPTSTPRMTLTPTPKKHSPNAGTGSKRLTSPMMHLAHELNKSPSTPNIKAKRALPMTPTPKNNSSTSLGDSF